MNLRLTHCLMVSLLGILLASELPAQTTAFTYQGHVRVDGNSFHDLGQFKFALVSQEMDFARTATAKVNVNAFTGVISGITVLNGGFGYTSAPTVTISSLSGGSGGAATATISNGSVVSITVTSPGSGYKFAWPPSARLSAPPPTPGNDTYWSNDGTSQMGSEPSSAVEVFVDQGLFTVRLGDDLLLNMTPIPVEVFLNPSMSLRIWFNDGVQGFSVLSPDQPLTSTPYAIRSIRADSVPDAGLSTNVALLDGSPSFTGIVSAGSFHITESIFNNPVAGTIRWTGRDFEGYNGMDWLPLTPPEPPPFIQFVTVRDIGNPNGPVAVGAVDHTFQIGKYEITNDQYAKFLNAVAQSDPGELYDDEMETDELGGILQSGSSGSFVYSVKPDMGNKPVLLVSFWSALRFCNWLHNGMPVGAQDVSTTEDGAYTMNPSEMANNSLLRNVGARYFIPTEDQWYKTAYYDPTKDGTGGYWLYPTQGDDPPTVATADAVGNINNDSSQIANHDLGADWNGQDGYVTTVGSGGEGSESYYGAADMGGNVAEWNEAVVSDIYRAVRGGGWLSSAGAMSGISRNVFRPDSASYWVGFRVARP